jgi:ubiquitin carboxyl-terminal hydrolase MINDY-1/2
MKPPRPAVVTAPLSAAEIAKNAEYRNETYQIKHFNWFDHVSGRLRRSSMLTQNKNGPCPLLALVNALILGAKDESQAALDDALRDREQVSLGLIIETLMYEIVDRSATAGQQLPDVDELNAFLLRLRTGMNANPRFVNPSAPAPNIMDARNSIMHLPQAERAQSKLGTFESTGDMKLYGAFAVPLIHGWIPEPGSEAARAFSRSAQTYEDAQAIQFGEEELEYKLTRDGLSPEEQRVWEDITSIKNFFKLHPTQLTPTGLQSIQQLLQSGSFAIMFRNDHFSTIYKHPQSGQLFILVTDQGYADRDEIVWESLVDISGMGNDFFSGDFMPVSHQQAAASNSTRSQHLSVDHGQNAPLSPQEQQEQHDADFAMALQMQEEEEQRQRADQARRRRSGQGQGQGQATTTSASHSPRGSQGNIPITLHQTRSRQSNSDAPENRPAIPARNRPSVPMTNRPTDANDEDAPPAYEEAAKGKPYIPPVGSPLHPSHGPGSDNNTPMSSTGQLSGTVSTAGGPSSSAHPPGPNAPYYGSTTSLAGNRPSQGNRIPSNMSGRVSAYNEQSGAGLQTPTQQMPGAYNWEGRRPQQGGPVSLSGRQGRQPGQERDCVVM